MNLQHTIKTIVRKGDSHDVAEFVEVAVVTQGKKLDEAVKNLKEAVELHLQGIDLTETGPRTQSHSHRDHGT